MRARRLLLLVVGKSAEGEERRNRSGRRCLCYYRTVGLLEESWGTAGGRRTPGRESRKTGVFRTVECGAVTEETNQRWRVKQYLGEHLTTVECTTVTEGRLDNGKVYDINGLDNSGIRY